MQALNRDVVKTQAGSKHQQTGMAWARHRVILGYAQVLDRRTISRGLEKRGSSITCNNPNKVYTESEMMRQG